MREKPGYQVSVIVLTYQPVPEKLFFTLNSIIRQKNIRFELIIADDGSENSLFSEASHYLESRGFRNFSFVLNEANRGTVCNVQSALNKACGRYVKLLSPGDALASEDTLAQWVRRLEQSGKRWSFGDVVYYRRDPENRMRIVSEKSQPQIVSCYRHGHDRTSRWNYVVLHDTAVGADTVCERELMREYIGRLTGRVKYVEDCIYRLMMFDGILPEYCPVNAVLYEVGNGISTSGNPVWEKRIREDWEAAGQIMLSGASGSDPFQNRAAGSYRRQKMKCRLLRRLNRVLIDRGLLLSLKWHFYPRMSEETLNADTFCFLSPDGERTESGTAPRV